MFTNINRSKKDLPGDPKLLRLQQKIRKQKEKQKAETIRGHRRKEKIHQLQALLRNKSKITGISTNPAQLRGGCYSNRQYYYGDHITCLI